MPALQFPIKLHRCGVDGVLRHGKHNDTPRFCQRRANTFSARPGNRSSITSASAIPEALQAAVAAASTPHPGIAAGLLVNTAVYTAGIKVLLAGLTPAGVAHSWLLGATCYSAFGPRGYLLVCLYFILGTLVTKWKQAEKAAKGIAEPNKGLRGPASVWGSGLAGMLCAVLALATGRYDIFQVGFVASFGSKLADTVSSEVGKAAGKTPFLMKWPFPVVPPGTEGAVSVEGTLAGVVAAAGFSVLAFSLGQVDLPQTYVCSAAIVAANVFESFLGATTQGQVEWLTNDAVNMIQICVAALLAIGGCQLLQL